MRKIIFLCLGNVVLFILFGLAFLFPFANVTQTNTRFSASITIFPVLLLVYLIAYPITYYALSRIYKWGKKENTELFFTDEREKVIVSEATKLSYIILVGGIIATVAILGGTKFFSMITNLEITSYFIAVIALIIVLVVSTISYCIKWCSEYRK